MTMKMTLTAFAAAATVAITAMAAPTSADAHWRGRGGGAVAAGVIGGIAAGALIAGATRPSYGYGYGGPAYYPAPAYYGGPACTWRRERFWDGYGWRVRRVQVCY
jgi:hypothetical protein